MPLLKLLRHLDREGIPYTVISHPPAFSAQKAAAAAHVRGRELAKVVIVKADGQLAMGVLPSNHFLSLESLRAAIHATSVELASEWEFKDHFPDCEAGAMPPLGNLYGLPVFLSDALAAGEYMVFAAGNHAEMVRMRSQDFIRLVLPRVVVLSEAAVR